MNWTEVPSLGVGFAVWILERDGLCVRPFDAHSDGDGQLQALGLHETNWSPWLKAIVDAESAFTEYLSSHDIRTLDMSQREEIRRLDEQRHPIGRWAGSLELRAVLAELWSSYRPIGEAWVSDLSAGKRHTRLPPSQERSLWRRLQPMHLGLATLRVYPVSYRRVVAVAIPPDSCVVGIGTVPTAASYVEAVTSAAQDLGNRIS